MQTALLVAKILSGVSYALVALVVWDLRRRPAVPSFSYGGVELSAKRLKAVWYALVLGALAVGSSRDPIATVTGGFDHADPSEEGSVTRRSVTLPLPFYRFERERRSVGGVVVEESVLEGLVLPWPFLSALLAYYVLVVRWNPDNRLARRLLEGRRPGGGEDRS